MRFNVKRFFFLGLTCFVLVFFNATTVLAFGDPSVPIEPDYDPDNVVPIDGGASLLIAAGVAYGLKKIHDKKKGKDSENIG